MKKLFYLLPALFLAFMTSCSENDTPCDQGDGSVVVTFAQEPLSRAFFDDTAQAEVWEKKINMAFIVVFDPSGNLVLRKDLNAAEIAAGQTAFSLSRDVLGKECTFYAVANLEWELDIPTRGYLLSLLDTQVSVYNGTAEEVMSGCTRPAGFIMTGKVAKTVSSYGSITHVALTVKRNVAKVAFRYRVDEEFYSTFKGAQVRIDKVTILNTCSNVMMFEDSSFPNSTSRSYSHEQEIFGAGALFYVYPLQPQESETDYAMLLLDGVFAPEGNFDSEENQRVQYQLPIMGSGKGELRRNGYYRIETSIKGISGQDASALLKASEWESPVSQYTGVGK